MNKLFAIALLSASAAQAGELRIPLDNNPVFMGHILNKCNAQWAGGGSTMDKAQFMSQCKAREYATLITNMQLVSASGIQQYNLTPGAPVAAGTEKIVIKNCAGQVEAYRRTVKVEFKENASVTTNNSVKVSYGSSQSATVTGPEDTLKLGVNKDQSLTINLSKSQTSSIKFSKIDTDDISVDILPYTALIIEYRHTRADTNMNFSGNFRLHTSLYGGVTDNTSYPLSGVAVYSNTYLASEKDYFEEALPTDPNACRNYQIPGARVL